MTNCINPDLFNNMKDDILEKYFEKAKNYEIENGIIACNIFYASLKRFRENKHIVECLRAIDYQKQRRSTTEDLIIENLILDVLNTNEKLKEFKEYQKNLNNNHMIETMFMGYIIGILYEKEHKNFSQKDFKKFYDNI